MNEFKRFRSGLEKASLPFPLIPLSPCVSSAFFLKSKEGVLNANRIK
jgi:hypothetical protein